MEPIVNTLTAPANSIRIAHSVFSMKGVFGMKFLQKLLTGGALLLIQGAYASEATLVVPDLTKVSFFGHTGHQILLYGLLICAFGMLFGVVQYAQIRAIKIHKSMSSIAELIYSTCKTYLVTQGKLILLLELLVGAVMVAYFGIFAKFSTEKIALVIGCSLIGILGSYIVAWFGMRINTLANARSAFSGLKGKPFPCYAIPIKAGMSIGMLLISLELFVMLCILLFIGPEYAGSCFIGFAIGESLGASVLRIAGGIFTKIADIGSDLMKIVFKIKEDDARNPGVIADCVGDNAGDSVGPTADGFETYGVTGVALISFIILAVHDPLIQAQLLVWIFVMRLAMIIASSVSYWINDIIAKAIFGKRDKMDFETPLTSLVWITSFVSIGMIYLISYYMIPLLGDGSLWWKLATIITCGTAAGAIIPEVVKMFTSTSSPHVQHILHSSRSGGASLNILSGMTVGHFSAYWMGIIIISLMGIAYGVSTLGFASIMLAPAVFAFGLVAFGFLGMGPVNYCR